MKQTIQRILGALRHPVHPETRANLQRLWGELAPELQTRAQLFGRQWEGCGATLGAMPRCDFACTACYLGSEANAVPPASLSALREQLRLLRSRVGRRGNVQLTDGELTLRPVEELVELVRMARELELIPMLMTHGDAIRRDPGLLERLVVEGGLSEISFHVDTTQRGRFGVSHPDGERALAEVDLHPLREEFGDIVRDIRRRTGRELRVASTVTVTASNLEGVSAIASWMLANNDVFRILSFQPVARVGRTRERVGVTRAELWARVAEGLGEPADALMSSNQLFGHPDCTHVVMGAVWRSASAVPRFVPLRDPADERSERDLEHFFERFGGLSFRDDTRPEAALRVIGLLLASPGFWLGRAPGFARRWLARLARVADCSGGSSAGGSLRALTRMATGRARLGAMALVSHHFMDARELETEVGRARDAACVFRVPYKGELVSMCRLNATGLRRAHYVSLAGTPDLPPPLRPPASPESPRPPVHVECGS